MSINRVNISGNLTRDAELKATNSGSQVLNVGVAVNDRRRNKDGDWEDYPNYVDCVMFGSRAQAIQRYLTKGTKVAIEGRLHYSSWEDSQTNRRRSKLEVYIDEIEFLSSRNGSQGADQGYQQPQQSYPQQSSYPAQQAPQQYAAPAPQQQPAYPPQQTYQQPQQTYPQQDQQYAQPAYNAPAPAAEPQQAPQSPAVAAPPSADVFDEDIPF